MLAIAQKHAEKHFRLLMIPVSHARTNPVPENKIGVRVTRLLLQEKEEKISCSLFVFFLFLVDAPLAVPA